MMPRPLSAHAAQRSLPRRLDRLAGWLFIAGLAIAFYLSGLR